MKTIPVCYCGNRGIFGGILLSLLSMVRYTASALDVVLLTMELPELDPRYLGFTEEQRKMLEAVLRESNPESRVRVIDVTEYQKKYFSDGKNNKNGYTPYASIRLFLDLLDVPDKLVYLDADVMCTGSVDEYYDIDVSSYELAATLDVIGRRFFPHNYCNSGVLLLNLAKIRESGLFERARRRVRRQKMLMPDQTAIHRECKAKLIVPYRFNEQRDLKADTVFKHFCKGYKWNGALITSYNYKQWHREMVREKLGIHDFDDVYERYDEIIAREGFAELVK